MHLGQKCPLQRPMDCPQFQGRVQSGSEPFSCGRGDHRVAGALPTPEASPAPRPRAQPALESSFICPHLHLLECDQGAAADHDGGVERL